MSKRTVQLTKDGHEYVFSYALGHEGQIVDEFMQLAADRETEFDWLDAATLGFQVAQRAAEDCCTEIMSPSHVARNSNEADMDMDMDIDIDDDDAKDGPCTNHNGPG